MKAPTSPGLYWLALHDGAQFVFDQPLLVRVSLIDGDGRIEFLDMPDRNPERHFNPIIDEPCGSGQSSAGLIAFENGTIHTLHYRREPVALQWLGPVKPPKMPAGVKL